MMVKTTLFLALAGTALALSPAHATSIAASGGDGALALHADTALLPALSANLDYLHTGSDRGDAKLYSAGVMISPPTPLLHWAVGARYLHQDSRWGKGGGAQLGASLFVDTPIPLLTVGGYGWYMPASLAQGRIRHSEDVGAQLRFGFSRSFQAWAGYRYLRTAFEGAGTRTLYRGPTVGLSVGF